MFTGAARTLVETDFADACPIATVALEVASTNDTLRRATSDVFDGWINAATDRLERGRHHSARGHGSWRSATIALARRSVRPEPLACAATEPVDVAGVTATAEVRAALPPARRSRRRPSTNDG